MWKHDSPDNQSGYPECRYLEEANLGFTPLPSWGQGQNKGHSWAAKTL